MGLTAKYRGRGVGGDLPCPASTLDVLADYLALGLPPTRRDVAEIRRAAGEIRRLRAEVEADKSTDHLIQAFRDARI